MHNLSRTKGHYRNHYFAITKITHHLCQIPTCSTIFHTLFPTFQCAVCTWPPSKISDCCNFPLFLIAFVPNHGGQICVSAFYHQSYWHWWCFYCHKISIQIQTYKIKMLVTPFGETLTASMVFCEASGRARQVWIVKGSEWIIYWSEASHTSAELYHCKIPLNYLISLNVALKKNAIIPQYQLCRYWYRIISRDNINSPASEVTIVIPHQRLL